MGLGLALLGLGDRGCRSEGGGAESGGTWRSKGGGPGRWSEQVLGSERGGLGGLGESLMEEAWRSEEGGWGGTEAGGLATEGGGTHLAIRGRSRELG